MCFTLPAPARKDGAKGEKEETEKRSDKETEGESYMGLHH